MKAIQNIGIFVMICATSLTGFAQKIEEGVISQGLFFPEFIDSTVRQVGSKHVVNVENEFYSSHYDFSTEDGHRISINIYADSIMFYEERDSLDNFVRSGNLRLDTNRKTIINEDHLYYEELGDQIFYLWVKEGRWIERIFPEAAEVSIYAMGTLQESFVQIAPWSLGNQKIIVPKENYTITDGKYQFIPSKDYDIESYILGTWHHPYYNAIVNRKSPIWVFTRSEPSTFATFGPVKSTFKKNNKYEGERRVSCGTGVTKADTNPKYDWKITADGQLKLSRKLYDIIYMDDETMILKD